MDLTQVKIETGRLLLVPVSTEYTEQLFSGYREPVIQYMNHGPAESLEVLKERILQKEKDTKDGLQLPLVVLNKETKEFLGSFVLEDLDGRTPEMGGWLKESALGNHYGQEATAALKNWADENLDFDYIIWPCVATNVPSRKLAESLGGRVEKEYEKKTARGKVWPYVEYWISKKL